MKKCLKTIHFDQSDSHVYEETAIGDEWAISGGFAFSDETKESLSGKTKQAFTNGFLSLESFGRATFTSVAELDEKTETALIQSLAQHFVVNYSAPNQKAAVPAAKQEIDFIIDLCAKHPINTVFTVKRFFSENNEIREEYRTVTPPSEPLHARVWDIVEE